MIGYQIKITVITEDWSISLHSCDGDVQLRTSVH